MRRSSRLPATVLALLAVLWIPAAWAQEDEGEKPSFSLVLNGIYKFDGYSQNNFFLGRNPAGAVSDKDEYGIQILRLRPEVRYGKHVKAVARIDLAQGIWGLDNSLRDNFRPGFSNLFNDKDTSFEVHLDWAYVEFTPPKSQKWTFRVGRMKNKLGNLLVLDQNGDGIQVEHRGGSWSLILDWTTQFEGTDGLTDENFSPAGPDGRDADLVYLGFDIQRGDHVLNPYVSYYVDRGDSDGTTYLPNELQYFRSRFQPNVSDATVLGFAWQGKLGRTAWKGEASWLTGSDDVDNTSSGPRELLDVNNGDLEGYNLFVDFKVPVGPGSLGAFFGMGSGDDDFMSGEGNINKIKANGHFYITEVWEDSVMPDEEGITPQGLGSPAHRGHRELENTTLLQLSWQQTLGQRLSLFLSGTYLKATEEWRPWSDLDGNGAIDPGEFGAEGSDDFGSELDVRVDWKFMDQMVWTVRGGIFFADDAAGFMLNGTNEFLDDAWELRTTLSFSFDLGTDKK